MLDSLLRSRTGIRQVTLEQLASRGRLCWGTPEEVREALITRAEALGSNTVLLNFNQGAMPHDMFMRTVRRFGEDVLPALQAHDVTSVPMA